MLKATGIIRDLDKLGRITLPIELRRNYGIKEGDPVEIFTVEDGIMLKPHREPNLELLEQLKVELNKAVGADRAERIMAMIGKMK